MKTIDNNIKKGVLYARVSSDKQEKEGFSVPAQIKFIKAYAQKNNIKIVAEFVEAETGKRAGREEFNNMIKFLKKNKTVRAILVEKTDRLYRNLKDYVTIDELENAEIHLIKENSILSEKSRSHDKFMHGIRVLMAKNYIDNLSEEVKKGMNEKASQGFFPAKAPFGYNNVKIKNGKNIIEVDETNAKYVKQIFFEYATGKYSYTTLAKKMTADGFRPNGQICTTKFIERILNNSFYIGRFIYNGKTYLHARHKALIEETMYFHCQDIMRNKYPTSPRKHDFAYNGLIKCANCGCQLVGEIKKGKYIYYHCTNSKGMDASKPSIREEKIEEAFSEFIKKLTFTKEEAKEVLKVVKDFVLQGCNYIEDTTNDIKKRMDLLNKRLNKLYDDWADGIITDEFYYGKRDLWQNEYDDLLIKFQQVGNSNKNLLLEAETIIELVKNAYSLYIQADSHKKAELMKLLTIELLFNGSELIITPHSAFYYLLQLKNCHMVGVVSTESNFFVQKFIESLSDYNLFTAIETFKNVA